MLKNVQSGDTLRRKQAHKAKIRRTLLQRMPKGGVGVEIGVWRGEFTRMLLNQLEPDRLILIDPWQSFDDRDAAFDGQTDNDRFEEIFLEVQAKYAKEIEAGVIEVQRGLSGDVLAAMQPGSLDFAYLDGDHSYEGVAADLDALLPLLKSGGVIMMDDFHRKGWWGDGVIRAAQEFIGKHSQEVQIKALVGAQLAISKL